MLRLLNLGLCLIVTVTTGFADTTTTTQKPFDFQNNTLETIMSEQIQANIERVLFPTQYEQVNLSLSDFEFMARVVAAEAGLDHWDNQVAVAQVIWNRVDSDQFEDTVYDVLTESGQFSTVDYGECHTETNDQCRDAIVEAYVNRPHPSNVLFFRADYYFSGLERYAKVADNYFSFG